MTEPEDKHDFVYNYATAILKKNNYRIFAIENGKEVELFNLDKFPKLNRKNMTLNVKLEETNRKIPEIIKVPNAQRLKEYGFKIIQVFNDFGEAYYDIVLLSHPNPGVDKLGPGINIEYDKANGCARLIGRRVVSSSLPGRTDWVFKQTKFQNPLHKLAQKPLMFDDYILAKHNLDEGNAIILKSVEIEETPLIYTDDDKIVCIDFRNLTDEPTIGVVGRKGTGKSFGIHSLCDRVFWTTDILMGHLNDVLNETPTWHRPWNPFRNIAMVNKLSQFGEIPIGLPMVYIYPKIVTQRDSKTGNKTFTPFLTHNLLSYKMSLSFKELLIKSDIYFDEKANPAWGLPPKTLSTLKSIQQELYDIRDPEDLLQMVEKFIPDNRMVAAINRVINSLISEGNLDSIPDENGRYWASRWKLIGEKIKQEENPFIAALLAGCFPTLMTSSIVNKDYGQVYPHIIGKEIFDRQINDPFFRENQLRIWLIFDEITAYMRKNRVDLINNLAKEIVTRGRPARIGFIWSTQNPEKVSDEIYKNSAIMFIFRLQDRNTASKIIKDLEIDESYVDEVLRLKKLECLVYSSDFPMVVYDLKGNKTIEEGKVYKGKFFPTLSVHKAPRQKTTKLNIIR